MVRSGRLTLKINDVICIKLNGYVTSFLFCGRKYNRFLEFLDFLTEEKKRYMDELHKFEIVLNVLDGRIYRMDEIDTRKQKIYCITQEVFSPPKNKGGIMTSYSILMLKDDAIINVNPHSKPFVMISNAMYYYKIFRMYDDTILLTDLKEMEILRDYRELVHEKLVL